MDHKSRASRRFLPRTWIAQHRDLRIVGTVGTIASAVPALVFLAVYLPAAGHGFVSDDFRWLLNSRLDSFADVFRLFQISDGFYRPLVSLTFGLDHLMFGLDPRPYGWTNVGLVAITALLVWKLATTFGLPTGAATLAASLWLLNFHGINQSILWICGRTSLMVAWAGTASAIFLVRRQPWPALGFFALALFAKEEAFTLPVVLAGWLYLLTDAPLGERFRTLVIWLIGSGLIIAVYLLLRAPTGAMTPFNAPAYYRFTFAPAAVGRNALEYADRAATVSTIAVLLGWLLLWPRGIRLEPVYRRVLGCAAIWLVGGYGITVFLPVRSSLYAVVPSIGACLAAAVLLTTFWQAASLPHRLRTLSVGILLPLCLMPVYRARMATVPLAEFSTQVLRDLGEHARRLPEHATVVVIDDTRTRISVASAFGTTLNDAVLLHTGKALMMWLVPPVPGTEGLRTPCASCVDLRLRVDRGRLIAFP